MNNGREKDFKSFGSGGRSANMILIVCSLLYMINYMDRQVLSVVLEPMKADLGLTDTQAGVLQTVFFLSMSLCAFPVSFLVDRWSRRKAVGIMAIIWSGATFLTGLGRSFVTVLASRIIVGSGEAGFSSGGTAWITAAYPKGSRGKALGIFNMAIPFGASIGVVLGGYLSTHHGGWRTPFFVFAVPGILLGIIAWFLKDYQTIQTTQKDNASANYFSDTLSLWRIPTLRWLFIGYGMHNLMIFSVLAWLPAVLMRSLDLHESEAGIAMGGIGIVSIFGALLGGWLADAWHRRNPQGRMLLPAVADLLAACLNVLALMFLFKYGSREALNTTPMLAAAGIGVLYGIFSIMGTPALGAVTQDVVAPRIKGISWGMAMFCMYMLGGAWGPVLVGTFSDVLGGGAGALQIALMIVSIPGLLAAWCFKISARTYQADAEKAENSEAVMEES